MLDDIFSQKVYEFFGPDVAFFRLNDKLDQKTAPVQIAANKIEDWNNQENRWSIFFTPNGDQAATKKPSARSEADCKNIYCLHVDIDQSPETKHQTW